jgi:LEA14-like dessication related protein
MNRRSVQFEPSRQPLLNERADSVYGNLYESRGARPAAVCCGCCRTRARCVVSVCAAVLVSVAAACLAAYYWLVPLVAARAIANAAFLVESVRVASPADQGFQLAMRVAIGPLPVAVHVDASVVHLLYGPDLVDLGTTSLPAIDLAAGQRAVLQQNATFAIADFDLLTRMFHALVNDASVQWTLHAQASAVVWGIPFHNIDIQKAVTIEAFDGFPQRAIDVFGVAGVAPDGAGVQIYCDARLDNLSPIEMHFNNAVFDIVAPGNVTIGRVHAPSLDIVQGNQTLALNGTLYAGSDPVKSAAIGALVSAMLQSAAAAAGDNAANTSVTVRGVSATTDANETVGWLDGLMRSFAISDTVPPLPDPEPLRDIVFETVSIDFGDTIMANITTAVTFYIPPQFSFPFTVTQSRLQMHMIFQNATASTLDVPWTAVQSVGPHRVRVVATNISVAYDTALFSALLVDAFNAVNYTVQTAGLAWATVSSPIADSLTLSAVPFEASVTFRGADGFANGLLLEWIQLVGSVPGVASLVGTIRVINNATLSARPGTFTLGVYVDDVYVGNATSVAPTLPVGTSSHYVTGFLVQTPTNLVARQKLMTRYATGRETPAQLRGSSNGTTVPVLKPAFSALRSNTSFPGLSASSTGLLLGVELTIDWLGLSAAGRIQVANPMSVAITVDAADFDVQFNGTLVGTANHTLTPPITVPANGTTTTGTLDVHVVLSWVDVLAFYSLLCKNQTTVSANGTISFELAGGYVESRLPYFQDEIPIALFHFPSNHSAPLPCP